MRKLSDLFEEIEEICPSVELKRGILRNIEILDEARAKRLKAWSYAGFIASASTFIWAGLTFGGSFVESEFWSIISLALSDVQIVMANWRDFLYSAMETLPVVGAIAMLVPTSVLLWSLGQYFKANSYHHKYLIN